MPVDTDGSSFVFVGTNIDAIASSAGTANAGVNQVVTAFPRNTLGVTNTFEIIGVYAINTAISVDDLARESVFAIWTVRLTFGSEELPSSSLGEFGRTVNCDLESFTPDGCPRFYGGASARFGPFSLEPDQSFNVILETGLSLHAIVEAEPAAISEPSSLALLAAGCVVLAWSWSGYRASLLPSLVDATPESARQGQRPGKPTCQVLR
jgi:hypothetical protein